MIVRERAGRTQIAVLEDDVLVEHYVANETNTSMIGNVYLGRVQNVLPSMEAAFVDIGKGRNAVLYAGEVNWDAAGLEGQPRRIEQALKSGDTVLVQVTKDPLGHKGARLTSQVSLPGRYLVYVPNSSMTGISRKLPDTERSRLKKILKAVVPEDAGVIVRTAAEGASEEELARDVARLSAQWEDIQKKSSSSSGGSAPKLLHGEPDLTIRVVRDVFNEDFAKLVVSGNGAWDVVQPYLEQVAPDLAERASRWTSEQDVFAAHRVDEQLAKAMDRKVYLPSGGSLVIDRTEAMTVVDVNTGKFTGSGGNLEETVTRNNLEAAEEIVRQLRLRDIGGIIVVDFIDMVLESNRDLVLRRLVECLGRDRTKHQVAEVTSLGLVQMTRKRVGQGLLEVFSEPCEHCNGRGIIIHSEPVSKNGSGSSSGGSGTSGGGNGSSGRRRGKNGSASASGSGPAPGSGASAPAPRGPIPAGLVAPWRATPSTTTSTPSTTTSTPSTTTSMVSMAMSVRIRTTGTRTMSRRTMGTAHPR
jgi:ribonuclease E